MSELLTSACPHTAMLMGLDAPTVEDHATLTATPRPTQTWFTITDHEGQAVDLNQPTAALMARTILQRLTPAPSSKALPPA